MMTVSRGEDWITSEHDGELFMMNVGQGVCLALNRVGAAIWELLEPPREIEDLYRELLERFDVDAQVCRAQVDAFLDAMSAHGAVRTSDPFPCEPVELPEPRSA